MNRFLFFYKDLETTSRIIEGRLLYIDGDNHKILNVYRTTSGQPGYQTPNGTAIRGKGVIPEPQRVGLDHYKVLTKPIPMPGLPGVDGNFYKINPHMVKLPRGGQRGDFGIHLDANGIQGLPRIGNYAPGSAGCIVCVTMIGWKAFEEDMKQLQLAGISEIPLLISYA